MGVEPNPEAREWQLSVGRWPRDCVLLPDALSDKVGTCELVYEPGRLRNASTDGAAVDGNKTNANARFIEVNTTTLDTLDDLYGPFDEAVVWLDIEGAEYRALLGAERLLARRSVLLFNLEMLSRVPDLMDGIKMLMTKHGYSAVKEWNVSGSCRDRIYTRD